MDVSVILCTYNRASLLQRSLAHLRRQLTAPNIKWELIVIDNNCSDNTPNILDRESQSFPVPFRAFRESKQGLSHARNRGIREARGTYLLFTDDDVETDCHWIESMWCTFMERSCDAVAGRVELRWLWPRPNWLTDELRGFLAYVDYGDKELSLHSEEQPPIGANMAYAAKVFERLGGFDPSLGRNADKLIGGEEIDLFNRFRQSGFMAIYQPRSIVYHSVDQDRSQKSYFRSLHFNSGKISGSRFHFMGKRVLGVPLFVLPQAFRSLSAFLRAVAEQGFSQSLRKEMTVWYFIGFIWGCKARCRAPHKYVS